MDPNEADPGFLEYFYNRFARIKGKKKMIVMAVRNQHKIDMRR